MSARLVGLLALLLPLTAQAEPYVLGDFEDGKAPGWSVYEEPAGVIRIEPAPDAAVGQGAIRVVYTRTGRWGYFDRAVNAARAAECNAVTFRIRGDGSSAAIVPRIATPRGNSFADPIVLADTTWRTVTIRLAHFYPRCTPEELAAIRMFRMTRLGVRQTFHYDLDQVEFVALPEVELNPPVLSEPRPSPDSTRETADAIAVRWRDGGSGVDPESAEVRVNTHDVTDRCEVTADGFVYRPEPPLTTGLWQIVTAEVRDRVGNRSERLRWTFQLGEPIRRRIELDGDNCPLVDGRPFFAIGLYSVGIDDMPVVREAGFNLIHNYRWEDTNDNDTAKAYLDAAYANDLMLFMGLNRGPVVKADYDVAVRRVETLKAHPAVLTWHAIDEPDGRENSDVWMPELYARVKAIDPDHLVSAVVCRFSGCARFIDSVDILQADYYPIPPYPPRNFVGQGFRGIPHMADYAMKASAGRKPYWYVAIAQRLSPRDAPSEQIRDPDYNDLKSSAWLSICRGARGVIWWQWSGAKRQPTTLEALQRVARELNDLMPLLTATTERRSGYLEGGTVCWMVKSDGRDTYAVGCNYEAVETTAAIPVGEGFRGAVEVPTGRELTIADGQLSDHYDGFETHVYRLIVD